MRLAERRDLVTVTFTVTFTVAHDGGERDTRRERELNTVPDGFTNRHSDSDLVSDRNREPRPREPEQRAKLALSSRRGEPDAPARGQP